MRRNRFRHFLEGGIVIGYRRARKMGIGHAASIPNGQADLNALHGLNPPPSRIANRKWADADIDTRLVRGRGCPWNNEHRERRWEQKRLMGKLPRHRRVARNGTDLARM